MDTTKYIQLLAKLQLLFLAIAIASSYFFESTLPPLLQEYKLEQDTSEMTGLAAIAIWPLMIAALVNIASLVAMIRIKVWSKSAYTYSLIALYLLGPTLGATVVDPITYTVESLDTILMGMMIALLYFTPSVFTPMNASPEGAEQQA